MATTLETTTRAGSAGRVRQALLTGFTVLIERVALAFGGLQIRRLARVA